MNIFGFMKRNRARVALAERDALEADRQRKEAEARWPEVRERAKWARANHDPDGFTALFVATIRETRT